MTCLVCDKNPALKGQDWCRLCAIAYVAQFMRGGKKVRA